MRNWSGGARIIVVLLILKMNNMWPSKVLGISLMAVSLFHAGAGQSKLACPAVRTTSGWLDLFPLPCIKHVECGVMGARHLCCKGYCTKAISASTSDHVAVQQKALQSEASKTSVIPLPVYASTSTTTTTTTTTTEKTTTVPSTTTTTTTSTTTSRPPPPPPPLPTVAAVVATSAAFAEPALQPFFQVIPIKTSKPKTTAKVTSSAITDKTPKLACPKSKNAPVILFPIPCENSKQCQKTSGPDQVCCGGRCVTGVKPPKIVKPPPTHLPLLGVIPRECPTEPLGELLFEVQTCSADVDCWPRVCCPDGKRSYCRTAKARLDLVPVASQINAPVRAVEQYLQCTPPPPYDLFPRPCSSSIDCFPNLCCAEGGKKHCRPPQRSLLALMAGIGRRVGTTIVNLRQAAAARDNNGWQQR